MPLRILRVILAHFFSSCLGHLKSLGETVRVRLGDVVLARSGDKGANINIGLFVRKESHYPWLKTFLTRARMQELIGDDWRDEFFIERCAWIGSDTIQVTGDIEKERGTVLNVFIHG